MAVAVAVAMAMAAAMVPCRHKFPPSLSHWSSAMMSKGVAFSFNPRPSLRSMANAATPTTAGPNPHDSTGIEVEIKLKLPDSAAHRKVSGLLSSFHLTTFTQDNVFFDSPGDDLAKNLAALRLRFYDGDARCVVSLKAKPVMSGGISRVEEEEEPLDPVMARSTLVPEPRRILSIDTSNIARRLRNDYGVDELVCLGGFRNVRTVYEWKGLKLELDETMYDFGTCYEIECETGDPDSDRKLIEGFLSDNGVRYTYSTMNKFAVFRSGKLPGNFE